MSGVRTFVRGSAVAAWTAGLVLAAVLASLGSRLASAGDAGAGTRSRLFRLWARGVARIIGMRVVASGEAPQGGFFLVANHLSYLDIVALGGLLEATFVAKADVGSWPVIGTLSRFVETVFVDRTRKRDLLRVLPLLENKLRSGTSVVVFPEGTTSDGSEVLPFKSPLFEAAVRAGYPAHVATLTYATPDGAPHPSFAVCWWGDMTFGRHALDLLRLQRFTAHVAFAPAAIFEPDRKRLARTAHGEAKQRFVPVSRGDLACLPARL